MGLACSKRKQAVVEGPSVRLSPFGRFRSLSRSLDEPVGDGPRSLLQLSVEAVCAALPWLSAHQLQRLPTDLAQLVLEQLIQTEALDDAAVAALAGQDFWAFDLAGYAKAPVTEGWLRCLCTPSLEAADLSKTAVGDHCLLPFLGLPNLRSLKLEHCVELTDMGLCALQGLTSLTQLSLAGCQQVSELGVRWVRRLVRLRVLSLEMCNQAGGLSELQALSELESLNVGWCGAVGDLDMLSVGRLGRLQDLQISYTRVTNTGVRALLRLTALTSLGMGGLRVSDGAVARLLRALPLLRVLSLERCGHVGDGAVEALAATAQGLEELTLAYTATTDIGVLALSALGALRHLSLDKCDKVTDRGARVVGQLTALQRLDLTDTGITNSTLHAVGKLRQLERLNLSFTGANDWGLDHLSGVTSLRRLSLDSEPAWHRFTDTGMRFLTALTNLEVLDLFAARISDAGCRHISKLRRLHSLEICSGYVSDVGVAHLAAGLRRLRHLSLAHNQRVTSASLPLLAGLTQLTALNLSECGVSGGIVVLSSLTNLDTLALQGTKVRPLAVERLQQLLPQLRVQGAKRG